MTADAYPGWSPNSHHPPGRDKPNTYWSRYHEYKYENYYRPKCDFNDDPFVDELQPNLKQNAWSILGIKETNDESIIRKAYYHLAREYHPDKGGDPADMVRLNNAYEWVMRFV
jgi:hypothetical protein